MTNAVPAPVSELLGVAGQVTPAWLRRLATGVVAAGGNTDNDESNAAAGDDAKGTTGAVIDSVGPDSQRCSVLGLDAGIETVIDRCATNLSAELEGLLSQDVEAQRRNPLAVFRDATVPLTAHLVALGYPARRRDRFDIERFPNDVYGFAPASWVDIDPALVAPGMAWGAWKAMTIIARHRNDEDSTTR